jgi:hypothetical protein
MAFAICSIDGNDYSLEYVKDFSDNTYSGILYLYSPVLFSYSDSLFIPSIDLKYQQAIKNTINSLEQKQQNNSLHEIDSGNYR